MAADIRYIDLRYDPAKSDQSALELVFTLNPDWRKSKDQIQFIRFTDGITNTLLKAINVKPGLSREEIDRDAVLLRAYGRGTDVLIDRQRECTAHSLLADYKLAPPLLARFENGLMYRFIPGKVSSPADLRKPEVWRGVARRLAEWHAVVPISAITSPLNEKSEGLQAALKSLPSPNLWTIARKWISALPMTTEEQKQRKERLSKELDWIIDELADTRGLAGQDLVFSHTDLLSGNVIIQNPFFDASPHSSSASSPTTSTISTEPPIASVSFIDYEYATPAPAAFDLANHFAEWGGFDCDFSVLPSRSQRRDFLTSYLSSYGSFSNQDFGQAEMDKLFADVDRFRGLPGFYWGIWGLIQATISHIDFDYATYAEIRLGEYWAWKDSLTNEGLQDIPLRERRWGEED